MVDAQICFTFLVSFILRVLPLLEKTRADVNLLWLFPVYAQTFYGALLLVSAAALGLAFLVLTCNDTVPKELDRLKAKSQAIAASQQLLEDSEAGRDARRQSQMDDGPEPEPEQSLVLLEVGAEYVDVFLTGGSLGQVTRLLWTLWTASRRPFS